MTDPASPPSGHAPEQIETARLVLRRPTAADAGAIFARYAADPEVTRYLSWARHESVESVRGFLAFSDDHWQRWPAGPYLAFDRQAGTLLGSGGFLFDSPSKASTGYVLARDAWGRGFASEILAAAVALAPALGVVRLEAYCHVDHRPSRRVLEKGGFAHEGVLRRHAVFPNLGPEPCDVACYARVWPPDDGEPSR